MGKKYIYSRVSTDQQSADGQLSDLKTMYPDAQVISEVGSGMKRRPMLEALIENLKGGDFLIVYALDRLGRRTTDVLRMIEELEAKGINLISRREGVDYSTTTGKLVTQILLSVAEMERDLISERTKAGLRAAKEKGRLIGRKPSISDDVKSRAIKLVRDEGLSLRKAADLVGMNHAYLGKLVRSKDLDKNKPQVHAEQRQS